MSAFQLLLVSATKHAEAVIVLALCTNDDVGNMRLDGVDDDDAVDTNPVVSTVQRTQQERHSAN